MRPSNMSGQTDQEQFLEHEGDSGCGADRARGGDQQRALAVVAGPDLAPLEREDGRENEDDRRQPEGQATANEASPVADAQDDREAELAEIDIGPRRCRVTV